MSKYLVSNEWMNVVMVYGNGGYVLLDRDAWDDPVEAIIQIGYANGLDDALKKYVDYEMRIILDAIRNAEREGDEEAVEALIELAAETQEYRVERIEKHIREW